MVNSNPLIGVWLVYLELLCSCSLLLLLLQQDLDVGHQSGLVFRQVLTQLRSLHGKKTKSSVCAPGQTLITDPSF